MMLIYVASPFAGDIKKNVELARNVCRYVMQCGHAFFAPHLLYPTVLNYQMPEERSLGIAMGLEVLSHVDELWVFGTQVSAGMKMEIDQAAQLGIPIKMLDMSMPTAEECHE